MTPLFLLRMPDEIPVCIQPGHIQANLRQRCLVQNILKHIQSPYSQQASLQNTRFIVDGNAVSNNRRFQGHIHIHLRGGVFSVPSLLNHLLQFRRPLRDRQIPSQLPGHADAYLVASLLTVAQPQKQRCRPCPVNSVRQVFELQQTAVGDKAGQRFQRFNVRIHLALHIYLVLIDKGLHLRFI